MSDMNQSGKQGLGDLNGISSEIDKVIDELVKNNYDRNTNNRQQKILGRMLNSQKSMTQRGFEDERKSKTALQISSTTPLGLPSDLGQRKSILMEAMDQALSAGFSKEYQHMIQKYFNSLNTLETFSGSDTSRQF
jgi:predicted acetyltransferase